MTALEKEGRKDSCLSQTELPREHLLHLCFNKVHFIFKALEAYINED